MRLARMQWMINLKTPREIERMKGASRIVAEILLELREIVRDGITTAEIDRLAEEMTREEECHTGVQRAIAAFRRAFAFRSMMKSFTAFLRRKRMLKNGDVVGLDFGVVFDGFFGDSAVTVRLERSRRRSRTFLRVTEQALYTAIEAAVPGNYISDVSAAVQTVADEHHFGIVREFCGHGIGRALHEDPPVLNYVQSGKGPKVKPGLVIAIEPMINLGTEKVKVLEDGWTVVTLDGRPSAHFEHTIAVTPDGPEILTRV